MVYGYSTNYGQSIGILMLKTHFPRIPGDIGNATTFPFPVVYRVVEAANPNSVVNDPQSEVIDQFIEAAKELVEEGVRAIVTSCGFTAVFHDRLAAAVDVPVFSSSLVQLGLVHSMLKPSQKVGVITANAPKLTEGHFKGAGVAHVPRVVVGLEESPFFKNMLIGDGGHEIDVEATKRDMQEVARKLVQDHPEVGAIVLECTNMPPFAKAVQEATGLPVFDIVTLTKYVHSAVTQEDYHGYM